MAGPLGIPVKQMDKSRAWVFTWNNYEEENKTNILKLPIENTQVKYVGFGEEIGESGTPHLQGLIYFHNRVRFNSVKKVLNEKVHIEMMKGSIEESLAYCNKDGKYSESGTKPFSQKEKGESEKERWELALQSAKKRKLEDVPADIQIRYWSSLNKIAEHYKEKPENLEEVCGEWIWGPPGTGKSWTAREENPSHYIKDPNTKWWDGYDGEATVIIDDFNQGTPEMGTYIKLWTDIYPFRAEVKGGSIFIRPKRIIITSNGPIQAIFPESTGVSMVAALSRRFKVREFNTVYVKPPKETQIQKSVEKEISESDIDEFLLSNMVNPE